MGASPRRTDAAANSRRIRIPDMPSKHRTRRSLLAAGRLSAAEMASRQAMEFHRWLDTGLGASLLELESEALAPLLEKAFGYHILQLGCVNSKSLIAASAIGHRIHADACFAHRAHAGSAGDGERSLQVDLANLPLKSASIDAIVLHHALEFCVDSRAALREAVRVLRPGGKIFVLCFAPWSLWGIRRAGSALSSLLLPRRPSAPWSGRYRSRRQIGDWLELLEVQVTHERSAVHGLPLGSSYLGTSYLASSYLSSKLASLSDRLERSCARAKSPFGAVSVIGGIKVERPLTPTPLRWRSRSQPQLGGVVSTRQGYSTRGKVS